LVSKVSAMTEPTCTLCGRPLNNKEDELSGDCGGDCWGCIGQIEADMGYPPSIRMVTEEWRCGLRPNWTPPNVAVDLSDTVTLWRPVGDAELKLIEASGWRAFPPRLPDQPIFYPVLSEAYALQIARDWNAPRGGGWVTRFEVKRAFLEAYEVQQVGSRGHLEYWIPAGALAAFNDAIVGVIEVTAEFR
jgi:hypothetical protein